MVVHDLGCRFTWDVIKRHRDQCAIVLTTHSMVSFRMFLPFTQLCYTVHTANGKLSSQKVLSAQLLAGLLDSTAVKRQLVVGT